MATRRINSFIEHLMTEKVSTAGSAGAKGGGSSDTRGIGGGYRSGEGGGQDGGRRRSLRRDFFAPKLNPIDFPDQPGDDATDPSEYRPPIEGPVFTPPSPLYRPRYYDQRLRDAFRKYF